MLMRTDPFREVDRLAQQLRGGAAPGTWSRPAAMPMDAYRAGGEFVACFDLPGVDPEAVEVELERNVLTVKAERRPVRAGADARLQIAERPYGVFSRQVLLGEGLDPAGISAVYEAGVLTVRVPVAETAQPRRIAVSTAASGGDRQELTS